MTIAGAVTAALQPTGVYVPPFQRGAAQRPIILTTGTPGAGPTGTTGSTDPNPSLNPSVSPSAPGTGPYADAYLKAHMMSIPSYRYAVILWCVLGCIALAYALAHHLRLSGGGFGAGYTKWGMRRVTIGRRALPSNSLLVTMAIVTAAAVVLSLIGSDYIAPAVGMFEFGSKLATRAVASSTSPTWTISKALWTTGSRLGVTAFALMPLAVLLALKAPPFAVFSWPFFTALYSDQLATFHRAAGWLIFAITTAHVALWTVQMFQDQYNGKAVWFAAFTQVRFLFGCIAYFFMCLMMALSLRPVRNKKYEFFYYAHIVTVTLTLVACILHHPVLWYWVVAALGLWAGDRIWRAGRYMLLNSGGGKRAAVVAARNHAYQNVHGDDIALDEFSDKMLPAIPTEYQEPAYQQPASQRRKSHDPPQHYDSGYAIGDIQPLGTYAAAYGQPQGPKQSPRIRITTPGERRPSARAISNAPVLTALQPAPPVPPGFAQAQLLPSRTVRLTIRLPRAMKYAPGQSVLLTLPDLSKFQSHPFTMCGNDSEELVLLVKARKGLTSDLYDLVYKRSEDSMRGVERNSSVVPLATPVYVRARVDGPMGSSGRIRWRNYSTILIICGGSGVSFGIGLCDYLCNLMADGLFKSKVRRVRFVWIVREYAEIAWAASALCRARQLVGPSQLQIDIWVTNAAPNPNRQYDQYRPHRASYNGPMERSVSMDSVMSDLSAASDMNDDENNPYDSFEAEMENAGAQALDLSLYEGEEDYVDPAQSALSYQVRTQGKVSRARSRKKTGKRISRSDPMGGINTLVGYGGSSGQQTPAPYPPVPVPNPRYSQLGHGRPSTDSLGNPYAAPNRRSMDAGHRQSVDSLAPTAPPIFRGGHSPKPSIASMQTLDQRGSIDDTSRLLPPGAGSRPHSGQYSAEFPPSTSSLSLYEKYDSLSPSPSTYGFLSATPSADELARHALAIQSRTQSMVYLPSSGSTPLWIDEADYAAMSILAEMARSGRPRMGGIFDEEVALSAGSMAVATCGPTKLNTVVRNLVSRNIRPGMMMKGDKRGHVAIFSEDFES